MAGHPKNVLMPELLRRFWGIASDRSADFRTGDVSFLAGYTAKVAGTEAGVTEPQATLTVLWRALHGVAAEHLCPTARREDCEAQCGGGSLIPAGAAALMETASG